MAGKTTKTCLCFLLLWLSATVPNVLLAKNRASIHLGCAGWLKLIVIPDRSLSLEESALLGTFRVQIKNAVQMFYASAEIPRQSLQISSETVRRQLPLFTIRSRTLLFNRANRYYAALEQNDLPAARIAQQNLIWFAQDAVEYFELLGQLMTGELRSYFPAPLWEADPDAFNLLIALRELAAGQIPSPATLVRKLSESKGRQPVFFYKKAE